MPTTSQKRPLWVYVTGVIVVWAVILGSISLWDPVRFNEFALFCAGFLLGMLAMYIAVHLYRWK
jgi:cytochrome b subunit of formate dehydrogenase